MGYNLERLPPPSSRAAGDKAMVTEQPDGGVPNKSSQQWFCNAQGVSILGFISSLLLKVTWRDLARPGHWLFPSTQGDMYENAHQCCLWLGVGNYLSVHHWRTVEPQIVRNNRLDQWFSTRVILSPRKHLTMSGKIFDYHNSEVRGWRECYTSI